jgi:hypothetical protein
MSKRALAALAFLAVTATQALPAERDAPEPKAVETRIHRTIEREQAIDGQSYYVHAFVLDLVTVQHNGAWRQGKGTPVYRVVHVSEGPYDGFEAPARVQEIASKGLIIGTHFWPLSVVQRVEVRGQ